ncbi:MAG: bifunctional phosphopantothenoylcysteine decarboxylase/phosphopantothenate--cysteine ligase CoaBC [Bacteroidota bacterium]
MLKNKKILLGITGSIAAYKTAALVRLLKKAGAEVKIVMTPSSLEFVAPLTLSTLSRNAVLSTLAENDSWSNHVMLGRWADLMLIAPLSCNTLAKMSNGICDNLLMAVYLSATCPVIVAPAMDEDMWLHPSTQNNIHQIQSFGNKVIPVENGELASGLVGPGRMAEPENIIKWLEENIVYSKQLAGKKIMVTAGPTYEALDPVRFIGNHSSGKMGIAIAMECANRGAEVTLICGPVAETIPSVLKLIKVNSASQMYEACHHEFADMDIAIMSAAVADYSIKNPAVNKIKKADQQITIELEKTKDILQSLGTIKKSNQILVGFALETENETENAKLKLKSKKADYIVMNSLNNPGAGFGGDTNKISIFEKSGKEYHFETKIKTEVAKDIINTILNVQYV